MIEYKGVMKSFGGQTVLDGVDLAVKEGETFFVLGKTGAGKTVMIRMLVGLIRPDGGSIRMDGEELAGREEEDFQSIRRKCGMVFQLPTLFDSYSVFENVAFGLRRLGDVEEDEIFERVAESLRRVELDPEISERMPDELSFGEQKRVGLARTLVMNPKYLLYDEPTTGLDPFTAGKIDGLIKHLNESMNATSIVVSHDLMSMKNLADRVGVLWDGKFSFVGSVPEFMEATSESVLEFKKGLAEGGRKA